MGAALVEGGCACLRPAPGRRTFMIKPEWAGFMIAGSFGRYLAQTARDHGSGAGRGPGGAAAGVGVTTEVPGPGRPAATPREPHPWIINCGPLGGPLARGGLVGGFPSDVLVTDTGENAGRDQREVLLTEPAVSSRTAPDRGRAAAGRPRARPDGGAGVAPVAAGHPAGARAACKPGPAFARGLRPAMTQSAGDRSGAP